MPGTSLPPMTSRQAKKLHKKAGGPQWSYTASQMRQADRRDLLEERRKNVVEAEKKRKQNQIKREEKFEKEKCMKLKLLDEGKIPVEDTWGKVTASQPRLNDFFKKPFMKLHRSSDRVTPVDLEVQANQSGPDPKLSIEKDPFEEQHVEAGTSNTERSQQTSLEPPRKRQKLCDLPTELVSITVEANANKETKRLPIDDCDKHLFINAGSPAIRVSEKLETGRSDVSEKEGAGDNGNAANLLKQSKLDSSDENQRYVKLKTPDLLSKASPSDETGPRNVTPVQSLKPELSISIYNQQHEAATESLTELLADICTQDLEDYETLQDEQAHRHPTLESQHLTSRTSNQQNRTVTAGRQPHNAYGALGNDGLLESIKEEDILDEIDDETFLSVAGTQTPRRAQSETGQLNQQSPPVMRVPLKQFPLIQQSSAALKGHIQEPRSKRGLDRKTSDSFGYGAEDDEDLLTIACMLEKKTKNNYSPKSFQKSPKRRRLPWEINPLPPPSTEEAMLALWDEMDTVC